MGLGRGIEPLKGAWEQKAAKSRGDRGPGSPVPGGLGGLYASPSTGPPVSLPSQPPAASKGPSQSFVFRLTFHTFPKESS